jgi:hypothetical protein
LYQFLPYALSGSSVPGSRPVFIGPPDEEIIESALFYLLTNNCVPDTLDFLGDFAFAARRPPTGSVHEALGATGNGAKAVKVMDETRAASGAPFGPDTVLKGTAHKGGIDAGIKTLTWISLGQELGANPAGHGKNRIVVVYDVFDLIDIFRVTLSFQGFFNDIQGTTFFSPGDPEGAGQNAHFLAPTDIADRHTALTADKQDLVILSNHVDNFT